MTHKAALITLFLSISIPAYGDYFEGIQCGQKVTTLKGLTIDHEKPQNKVKLYKKLNEKAKFGSVESEYINYVFLSNRFYGKTYSIVGQENINEVLRFFKNEVEQIYKVDDQNQIFTHPLKMKDGSWMFFEPEKVIMIKRSSVHLGLVAIVCRKAWEERNGFNME